MISHQTKIRLVTMFPTLNYRHFLSPERGWEIKNAGYRNNSPKVQSRFRLYRLLRDLDAQPRIENLPIIDEQAETSTITDDDLWALSRSGWVLRHSRE